MRLQGALRCLHRDAQLGSGPFANIQKAEDSAPHPKPGMCQTPPHLQGQWGQRGRTCWAAPAGVETQKRMQRRMHCASVYNKGRHTQEMGPSSSRSRYFRKGESHAFACDSRMAVCCLTRATCKNVRQNLIPLATA